MGSSEAIVQRKADKRLPIVKDFVSVDLAAGPVVKSCDCRLVELDQHPQAIL